MASPLSPLTYFRRCPGRTLPMAFVIVLAVAAVASVVTIVHSIDLTVFTLYGYNRYLTGITPRNALTIPEDQMAKVRTIPELGEVCPSHSYQVMVKTIFGKMFFPIFGLDEHGRTLAMQRVGVSLATGRLPVDGEPEMVMSEDVARNLNLKLGDVVSSPESQDAYAPIPIKLVGTLKGRVWFGLTSKAVADANSPFTFTGCLLFSKSADLAQQRSLDRAVEKVIDRGEVREWQYSGLVKETRSALSNLYLILDLVVGIIVFAISFVCGLLSNIYFTQRLPEIATLAAIGYRRQYLMLRAGAETLLLCGLGWIMGCVLTYVLLTVLKAVFMTPKGLLLNTMDISAFGLTTPLPLSICLFAFITIVSRLRTLDPVSIIERRQ